MEVIGYNGLCHGPGAKIRIFRKASRKIYNILKGGILVKVCLDHGNCSSVDISVLYGSVPVLSVLMAVSEGPLPFSLLSFPNLVG